MIDGRGIVYPLEALHKREGWRLDALRAELAAATRRLEASTAALHSLQREHRAVATAAMPVAAAAIDPARARGCLLYLAEVQTRLAEAARSAGTLEQHRDRLRADGRRQHARLEAIERHRREYLEGESMRLDRVQSAEADRNWLALAHWRGAAGEGNAHE